MLRVASTHDALLDDAADARGDVGASYLFIKVAVEDIPPAPMMATRLLVAATLLIGYLAWQLGLDQAWRR